MSVALAKNVSLSDFKRSYAYVMHVRTFTTGHYMTDTQDDHLQGETIMGFHTDQRDQYNQFVVSELIERTENKDDFSIRVVTPGDHLTTTIIIERSPLGGERETVIQYHVV